MDSTTIEAAQTIRNFLVRCRNNIELFNRKFMRGPDLWSGVGTGYDGQLEWARAVQSYKTTCIASGNAVGKSTLTAQVLIPWWMCTRPGSLVVVIGASQSLLGTVTWRGISRAFGGYVANGVRRAPIVDCGAKISSGFASPATVELANGSRCIGMSSTSVERLSGQHNEHLLVILEEASGIPDFAWEAVDGLVPTKIVAIGNPLSNICKYADLYRQGERDEKLGIPPSKAVRSIRTPSYASPHIDLDHSPYGMASASWLESMARKWGRESLWWRTHVDALFPEESTEVVLSQALINRAMSDEARDSAEAHRRARKGGPVRIACDVGEGVGSARTVIIVRDDHGLLEVIADKHLGPNEAAEKIQFLAGKYGVSCERISFDAAGTTGQRLFQALKACGMSGCVAYRGGDSGGTQYTNMRTACAMAFARRLDPEAYLLGSRQDAPFHIPRFPGIEEALEELSELRSELKGDKVGLELKDDMARRLGRSPDFADSLCQSYMFEAIHDQR